MVPQSPWSVLVVPPALIEASFAFGEEPRRPVDAVASGDASGYADGSLIPIL
jgi:hypothetical protein